ncbi:transcriptional adapter 2-alpha-like isoform X2 [Rhipicephalus microplus]|uniref:transcriptional adapter 2-alpha-like isoform X2 n=1 Tax=Rhipicephalus microplus TaxID=6941 RepID=UPI003F6A5982
MRVSLPATLHLCSTRTSESTTSCTQVLRLSPAASAAASLLLCPTECWGTHHGLCCAPNNRLTWLVTWRPGVTLPTSLTTLQKWIWLTWISSIVQTPWIEVSSCNIIDKKLQLAVVSIYQDRLRERARRKWLVRRHGLIHPHKTRQNWCRYSTTLGEATTALLARFMQLLLPDDFDFLCEGLHSERLLCQQVQLLQESRRAGLVRLDSITLFKQCRRWRTAHRPKHTAFSELLAHVKNQVSTQVWLHKQLVKDASVDASSSKAIGRRKAPPLEIEGMPGYEKLNIRERELCADLRIMPEMYLHFKELLINEYEKLGSLRLANARAIIKIDVNKTRKLYDFLLAEGVIKKEIC